MRMPILPYFLFVGSALALILTFVGREIPDIPAIQVAQMVGVPAPFKAPPEEALSRLGD
jgi:hypothetical protein